MFDFKGLFDGFSKSSSTKFYKDMFDRLKSTFIHRITDVIEQHKKAKCGRNRTVDLNQVLNCMFFIADNGMKTSYIKDHFKMAKSTYYYYFSLISKHHILE